MCSSLQYSPWSWISPLNSLFYQINETGLINFIILNPRPMEQNIAATESFDSNLRFTYVANGPLISLPCLAKCKAWIPVCRSPSKPRKWMTFNNFGGSKDTAKWIEPKQKLTAAIKGRIFTGEHIFNSNLKFTYVANGPLISLPCLAKCKAWIPVCRSPSKPRKWMTFNNFGGSKDTAKWKRP